MRGRIAYAVATATCGLLGALAIAIPGIGASSPTGAVTQSRSETTAGTAASTAAAASAASTAVSSWIATGTHAQPVPGAVDLGAAPDSMPLTVAVSLTLHGQSELRTLIARRQILTQPQFMTRFAPSSAEANAVAAYLARMGFHSVGIEPNRLIVSATGTAAAAHRAF